MTSNSKTTDADQRFQFVLLGIAALCAFSGFIYWQLSRAETPGSVLAYQHLTIPNKGILESVADAAGVAFEPDTMSALPANHPSLNKADAALPSVGEMAGRLRQRLESDGGSNVQGWFLLGRTYMELKNYDQAVFAFARAQTLAPEDPAVMVSLADALSMQAGGAYEEKARRMIQQAIELNPGDQNARWMAGNIAIQQGDPASALSIWRALLPELDAARREQLSLQIESVSARANESTAVMRSVQDM